MRSRFQVLRLGQHISIFRSQKLAACAVLVLLAGCLGSDNSTPKAFQDAQLVLEEGITELEDGKFRAAKKTLEPLLDENDELGLALNHDINEKDKARYAFVIADSLVQINDWVNTASAILDVAAGAGLFAPGGLTPQNLRALGGEGFIASALDSLLDGFSDFFARNSDILAKVRENPEFQITFDELPLKFEALPIKLLDLGGEHDLAEANFLDSVYLLVDGVLKVFLATDFTLQLNSRNLPLNHLFDQFTLLFEGDEEGNVPTVDVVTNIVAVIFSQQKNLLGVADAPVMKEAGERFANSFGSLGNAINFILTEEDDQADDLVARAECEANDSATCLQLNIDFENLIVIDTDTLDELQIQINDDVTNGIDNIAAAFEGVANQRISWARDLVPLLTVVTTALIRSGFVEAFLEAVLAATGGDDTSLGGVSSFLDSGIISEDLIQGVFLGIIPDVLEFDVGFYFKNVPGGFRDWLPFWTLPTTRAVTDGTPAAEIEEIETVYHDARLFVEFECDDSESTAVDVSDTTKNPPVHSDGTQDFFCFSSDEFDPIDTDHFTPDYFPEITSDEFQIEHNKQVGNNGIPMWENLKEMSLLEDASSVNDIQPPNSDEFGMAADGIESSLGLVAFRDPTLSGILYIRLTADAPEEMDPYQFGPNTYFPATNRSLNALMQSLVQGVLDLVGSF